LTQSFGQNSQPLAGVRSGTQGINYALQELLAGLGIGEDRRNKEEFDAAIQKAMIEDPATITTQEAYDGSGVDGAMYDAPAQKEETSADPNQRSLKDRLSAAFKDISGNPNVGVFNQATLPGRLATDLAKTTRDEQRAYDTSQAPIRAQRAQAAYRYQQQNKAFRPNPEVPGKHKPYPPAVAGQLADINRGKYIAQAEARAYGTRLEDWYTEIAALPKAEQDALYMEGLLDTLKAHPGRTGVIGLPESISGAVFKVFGTALPGTQEAAFTARLDQIGGRQFLDAFESLKGGGQITQIEGQKATEAMSRLTQTGQPETAYDAAIDELKDIMQKAMVRARFRAQNKPSAPWAINGGRAGAAGAPAAFKPRPGFTPVKGVK